MGGRNMPGSCSREGAFVIHPADRLNVTRALLAPLIFFSPFLISVALPYQILIVALILAMICDTNYILHLQIHRPFSRIKSLNLLLEFCLGAVTGMTSSNWRIQHLYGHHFGVDYAYRIETAQELRKYSTRGAISFSARSIWPTMTGPFVEAYRKGILNNITSPINYRWAFCEQILLVVFVFVLMMLNMQIVLVYVIPWYLLNCFISRYIDYLNHYGCDEQSADIFSRANNSLSGWFNYTTNNFGFHTAHHLRPGAHWTELPDIHQKVADKIPQHCLKSFSWSFLMLPYHLYLSRLERM
jgi:fatty acid desaturase